MQLLLEQWASCNGMWRSSDFYIELKKKTRHRSFGCRKWLTKAELLVKYQSAEVVEAIVGAKRADAEVEKEFTRAHPDMHGVRTEDSWLGGFGMDKLIMISAIDRPIHAYSMHACNACIV